MHKTAYLSCRISETRRVRFRFMVGSYFIGPNIIRIISFYHIVGTHIQTLTLYGQFKDPNEPNYMKPEDLEETSLILGTYKLHIHIG